ncbi:hypothetical protein TVAG_208770 [Trichomonas vaginalis G3]|uniref:Uncharacterized protein n=1 Tax=Trichomonas vaginalis (strain ATCC PRA-98 / G3) TaxID=412133 RepID=A2DVB9_TRIV3|nr:WD40 repeat-like family [Trichomonas vaginalis G3]EAY15598.1 hypothetical protein TVAG_208770 [Trichomonas vaginalis G3]KAI5530206.1 WD40 repeat-like family [Trichomonas vaginalis G3]|eukprot:XP_001327821.1 hypothetical protein [Trichomonas vaginalis G3]
MDDIEVFTSIDNPVDFPTDDSNVYQRIVDGIAEISRKNPPITKQIEIQNNLTVSDPYNPKIQYVAKNQKNLSYIAKINQKELCWGQFTIFRSNIIDIKCMKELLFASFTDETISIIDTNTGISADASIYIPSGILRMECIDGDALVVISNKRRCKVWKFFDRHSSQLIFDQEFPIQLPNKFTIRLTQILHCPQFTLIISFNQIDYFYSYYSNCWIGTGSQLPSIFTDSREPQTIFEIQNEMFQKIVDEDPKFFDLLIGLIDYYSCKEKDSELLDVMSEIIEIAQLTETYSGVSTKDLFKESMLHIIQNRPQLAQFIKSSKEYKESIEESSAGAETIKEIKRKIEQEKGIYTPSVVVSYKPPFSLKERIKNAFNDAKKAVERLKQLKQELQKETEQNKTKSYPEHTIYPEYNMSKQTKLNTEFKSPVLKPKKANIMIPHLNTEKRSKFSSDEDDDVIEAIDDEEIETNKTTSSSSISPYKSMTESIHTTPEKEESITDVNTELDDPIEEISDTENQPQILSDVRRNIKSPKLPLVQLKSIPTNSMPKTFPKSSMPNSFPKSSAPPEPPNMISPKRQNVPTSPQISNHLGILPSPPQQKISSIKRFEVESDTDSDFDILKMAENDEQKFKSNQNEEKSKPKQNNEEIPKSSKNNNNNNQEEKSKSNQNEEKSKSSKNDEEKSEVEENLVKNNVPQPKQVKKEQSDDDFTLSLKEEESDNDDDIPRAQKPLKENIEINDYEPAINISSSDEEIILPTNIESQNKGTKQKQQEENNDLQEWGIFVTESSDDSDVDKLVEEHLSRVNSQTQSSSIPPSEKKYLNSSDESGVEFISEKSSRNNSQTTWNPHPIEPANNSIIKGPTWYRASQEKSKLSEQKTTKENNQQKSDTNNQQKSDTNNQQKSDTNNQQKSDKKIEETKKKIKKELPIPQVKETPENKEESTSNDKSNSSTQYQGPLNIVIDVTQQPPDTTDSLDETSFTLSDSDSDTNTTTNKEKVERPAPQQNDIYHQRLSEFIPPFSQVVPSNPKNQDDGKTNKENKEKGKKQKNKKDQKEKIEKEEKERLVKEEKEKLEKEQKEKIEKEEKERLEKEQKEKFEKEQKEKERLIKERLEKLAREQKEKLAKEQKEKLEKEQKEKERLIKERLEKLAREQKEKLAKEQKEKLEKEQKEKERIAKEQKEIFEKEQKEKERLIKKRLEKLAREQKEKLAREQKEKLAKEQKEKERIAKEQKEIFEKEQKEKERLIKERLEKLAREQKERREKEQKERLEKEEKERLEKERLAKEEQKEKENIQKVNEEKDKEETETKPTRNFAKRSKRKFDPIPAVAYVDQQSIDERAKKVEKDKEEENRRFIEQQKNLEEFKKSLGHDKKKEKKAETQRKRKEKDQSIYEEQMKILQKKKEEEEENKSKDNTSKSSDGKRIIKKEEVNTELSFITTKLIKEKQNIKEIIDNVKEHSSQSQENIKKRKEELDKQQKNEEEEKEKQNQNSFIMKLNKQRERIIQEFNESKNKEKKQPQKEEKTKEPMKKPTEIKQQPPKEEKPNKPMKKQTARRTPTSMVSASQVNKVYEGGSQYHDPEPKPTKSPQTKQTPQETKPVKQSPQNKPNKSPQSKPSGSLQAKQSPQEQKPKLQLSKRTPQNIRANFHPAQSSSGEEPYSAESSSSSSSSAESSSSSSTSTSSSSSSSDERPQQTTNQKRKYLAIRTNPNKANAPKK